MSRRRFVKSGLGVAAGLAIYAGEIERHWVEVARQDIRLSGLPAAFSGLRIAQLSDIHMDEYTEPFFLRHVVDRINGLRPDMVLLTGDYISDGLGAKSYAISAAWQCANILTGLDCRQVYAVLGNHDVGVDASAVTAALQAKGITLLTNASLPIERKGGRIWLAGLDDPVLGQPDPERAIPASIRNLSHEPVVLMCHAPDYADTLLEHPAGKAVGLILSGHTHGGQVRLPLVGAMQLPDMGKKYVEGWFQIGTMQLYVNRGIGTVGVPFRFDCPPEITLLTLRES
jgi:hypothetical protein